MEEKKMILNMLNEGKITAEEAARLLEALGESNEEEPKQKGKAENYEVQIIEADEGEKKNSNSNSNSKQFYKEPSLTSKISEVLDRVIKKVKDVDFDFNFGPSIEVQHIFQDQEMDFTSMNIEVPNGKVTLKSWDESGVRAECQAHVYKVETMDQARSKFIDAVTVESNLDKLLFKVEDKHVKVNVTLYVPRKQYQDVILNLGNGGLDITNLTPHVLRVASANGAVKLHNLSGKVLAIETKNGAIKIDDNRWEQGELETWNGAIHIDGSFVDIEAETLNGSITYHLPAAINGKAGFKTVTGKINISVPSELEVSGELKTFAGGINCLLSDVEIIENRKDYAQKFLKFKANNGAFSTYNVMAETKTGSVTIDKTR